MKKYLWVVGAVILGLIGFYLFDSIMGVLLGALAGSGKIKEKIDASKARSQESDRRQKSHEDQAEKHNEVADKHITEARKDVEHEHKTGDDLADRFRNR